MRLHLRYTLKINSETGELTDQGSFGDLLLPPKHEGLLKLLTHYHESYMSRGFYRMANLENELAARGMTQENAPIHYPYREDGLPIFKAIRKFVSDYLDERILKKAIPDFQCELAKIGGNTFSLDQTRSVTYPYLYPWLIPNSTST